MPYALEMVMRFIFRLFIPLVVYTIAGMIIGKVFGVLMGTKLIRIGGLCLLPNSIGATAGLLLAVLKTFVEMFLK